MPESLPPQDSNLPPTRPIPLDYASPHPSLTARKTISTGLGILVIVIAVISVLFIVGIVIPAITAARGPSGRVKCASNLRQIGQGLACYAANNRCYPRTFYDSTQPISFKPDFTGGAKTSPVSNAFTSEGKGNVGPNNTLAAMFLLVRTTELSAEVFVCPNSKQQKDTFTTGGIQLTSRDVSNFSSADNISYSFANPYPTTEAAALGYKWSLNMPAEFVIAADRNDGFIAPADAAKVAGLNSAHSQTQQQLANSRNHDREGQNVLYNDGSVGWVQTMWVGAGNDGIYTAAKTEQSRIPGISQQLSPAASKDTTTTDPQLVLDTILIPKF